MAEDVSIGGTWYPTGAAAAAANPNYATEYQQQQAMAQAGYSRDQDNPGFWVDSMGNNPNAADQMRAIGNYEQAKTVGNNSQQLQQLQQQSTPFNQSQEYTDMVNQMNQLQALYDSQYTGSQNELVQGGGALPGIGNPGGGLFDPQPQIPQVPQQPQIPYQQSFLQRAGMPQIQAPQAPQGQQGLISGWGAAPAGLFGAGLTGQGA